MTTGQTGGLPPSGDAVDGPAREALNYLMATVDEMVTGWVALRDLLDSMLQRIELLESWRN